MSIDAKITAIKVGDGKASLVLGQRTRKNPAGQQELYIDNFDGWLPDLGTEIWGNSGELFIGNTPVYKRTGHVHIERIKHG